MVDFVDFLLSAHLVAFSRFIKCTCQFRLLFLSTFKVADSPPDYTTLHIMSVIHLPKE